MTSQEDRDDVEWATEYSPLNKWKRNAPSKSHRVDLSALEPLKSPDKPYMDPYKASEPPPLVDPEWTLRKIREAVSCPRCQAIRGSACWSMSHNGIQDMKTVHVERRRAYRAK